MRDSIEAHGHPKLSVGLGNIKGGKVGGLGGGKGGWEGGKGGSALGLS